ncbi:STM4013/SEN3800 family hydrolase [Paenibacillus barcinonensis]|uniref:STM4013/SEN3800 family hydrolase n=1 Tax=Paenibacillus barcinonensis TaxID=198119 RepID=A0A2V4VQ79_PAEBA|nr:STM4013/SEN3800 family hydrolase [Paenibacillus barcinonensis]PYE44478.1 sulfatase-like protein [Paenibacillus barcinonensis]QKS56816.1 STM4013/SEN3800 family hydrolase [Paenibacillus barcinonensis]
MPDMNTIVGSHDILMITLDTLRYDVAKLEEQHCPNLCGSGTWEKRHTPGSFTYAAHHAFFGGFMPTPANTDKASHIRLFHSRNTGMKTHPHTWLFDTPDIVSGFAAEGYRTICIGGVIFFTKKNPLAKVLPGYFQQSYWRMNFGVTHPRSTENQVNHALKLLGQTAPDEKLFLFMNVSAIHGPNHYFVEGAREDSVETQRAALRYVDKALGPLFSAMRARERPTFCLVFSDHGTAYGEDGYHGHRLAHDVVWTVPYREFIL